MPQRLAASQAVETGLAPIDCADESIPRSTARRVSTIMMTNHAVKVANGIHHTSRPFHANGPVLRKMAMTPGRNDRLTHSCT